MNNQPRRVVLITRRTRLAELITRHNTYAQAQFYLEHLGADFADYLREDRAYTIALHSVTATLQQWGRYQHIDRSLLPNYAFAADDIVIALGQDGLVANTLKYLSGQPLIGINPEPARYDGILLPFEAAALPDVLAQTAADKRPHKTITLAEARLSDGQSLRAVNDLYIGVRSHTSARYEISYDGQHEQQSSSGLIISTGLGSTAWLKSIITGAQAIAAANGGKSSPPYQPLPWDSKKLRFAVREPFPSRHSSASIVYGHIQRDCPLRLRSLMAEDGVIFSDGIESDYLRFEAGIEASITLAATHGMLVQ